MDFVAQQRVRVRGLQARPDLNGCTGVVIGPFNCDKQRWPVRVQLLAGDSADAAAAGVEMLLRGENLEAEGPEFAGAGVAKCSSSMGVSASVAAAAAAQSSVQQLSAHYPAAPALLPYTPPAKPKHSVTVTSPKGPNSQNSKRKFAVQGSARKGSEQLECDCPHAGWLTAPSPQLIAAFNSIVTTCMSAYQQEKEWTQGDPALYKHPPPSSTPLFRFKSHVLRQVHPQRCQAVRVRVAATRLPRPPAA